MDAAAGTKSPLALVAAAIHAVTAGSSREPSRLAERSVFRTGAELLGWATQHHPSLLVHLTDEQLDRVARVLDGMLRERADPGA